VDPTASLDDLEKRKFLPPGLELRPLSHPARNQSLHQLRYPDSYLHVDWRILLKWILRMDDGMVWSGLIR
jgi:hypothetical protein